MKRVLLVIVLVTNITVLMATSFPTWGVDSAQSEFFRSRYQYGDLVSYLDNICENTVYQAETTGEWAMSDQLVFSVQGNSFRWNRYYWDGFRIDQRFTTGSTLYRPNLQYNSLALDTYQSRLYFTSDEEQSNYISLHGNAGNLGGISWGTKELINLFHKSASERFLYPTAGQNPLQYRSHIVGAGAAEGQFILKAPSGKAYRQHIYADLGWRQIASFNHQGLEGLYPDYYYKVQMNGEIPITADTTGTLPTLHYMANVSHRNSMGQEFYYNRNEVMENDTYSFSAYAKSGKKSNSPTIWTAGVTWATNTAKHADLCFARNMADQDGEAFEPWTPDGNTHELNASVTLRHEFLPWLHLTYDGFNSFIYFNPTQEQFSNQVYLQLIDDTNPTPYYRYDWTSKTFSTGILENTLGIEVAHKVNDWFAFMGKLDFTFDGVLLAGGKSFVRPNWQGQLTFNFTPTKWLEASLNLGNYRIAFNYETARFFSNDYLNGIIYDRNNQPLVPTGGQYHRLNAALQPSYFVLDIPVRLLFGRHEISLMQNYRKYYNLWTVDSYDAQSAMYVVDYLQTNATGDNILNASPYWVSQTTKYTYHGRRVTVSLSWQSMMMGAVGALGNGPLHNDIGMLSESTAYKNTYRVTTNPDSQYARVGRGDQDKAYICRFLVAYQIARDWQAALTFKFKDGQAFTNFDVEYTENGNPSLVPNSTKGINPVDGNFGKRDDAFFNLDLHLTYTARFKNNSALNVMLQGYNLYDFGTALTEYTFIQGHEEHGRYPMSICIPCGLNATIKYTF